MFGVYLSNWQADEGTSAQENLACVHKVELLALLKASGGREKKKKLLATGCDGRKGRHPPALASLEAGVLENRTKPSWFQSTKWFISLKRSL